MWACNMGGNTIRRSFDTELLSEKGRTTQIHQEQSFDTGKKL